MNLGLFKKLLQRSLSLNTQTSDADLGVLQHALNDERQARSALEEELSQKSVDFDIILKDRVRELTDANTQLSQINSSIAEMAMFSSSIASATKQQTTVADEVSNSLHSISSFHVCASCVYVHKQHLI